MKAIIIAAGLGSRLKELTQDQPKCLLKIQNKSILDWQLDAYRAYGIQDISIITGYKSEKIQSPVTRKFHNSDYKNNNILFSLMYAAGMFNDDLIVSYSDIIYKKEIVLKLLESSGSILTVVDKDWKKTYIGRKDHPTDQAEKVIVKDGCIRSIGKHLTDEDANGEFIGMFRLSKKSAILFRDVYEEIKSTYKNQPFQKAALVEKSYITDILQELIDRGQKVEPVYIEGGWREIDTQEDLEKANQVQW